MRFKDPESKQGHRAPLKFATMDTRIVSGVLEQTTKASIALYLLWYLVTLRPATHPCCWLSPSHDPTVPSSHPNPRIILVAIHPKTSLGKTQPQPRSNLRCGKTPMDGFKRGQDPIVQRLVHVQLVATAAKPAAFL